MIKTGLHDSVPKAALTVGAAGAIIGGSVSAARNIAKVKSGEMTSQEAARSALREAGTTGVSTATATVVVSALRLTGVLSVIGLVGAAVGTKILVDKAIDARCKHKALEEKPAPQKPAATKSAPGAKKTGSVTKKTTSAAKKTTSTAKKTTSAARKTTAGAPKATTATKSTKKVASDETDK